MVRRILRLISLDVSGVHAAAYLLAASAFSSQLLALIRDHLLAGTFGAGLKLDIYYAAFRIQDFIFFSVASLVSLAVLIPFLVEAVEKSKEETRAFLDSIFTVFFISVVIVSGVAFFLVPYIVPVIFPGLVNKGFNTDLFFITRLLLLSPLALGLSNLLGSVTQTYRKFFIYALSPLLYNVGIIIGIVAFYPVFGLKGLGFGVILGAILHLLIQMPFIISEGLFPRLTLRIRFKEVKRLVLLSLPRTLTLSLNHIAMLVLAGMASVLAEGSISVLNFSLNLGLVPVSIIGASYSVAAFPILVRHFLKEEKDNFNEHLRVSLRHIIFWSFPAVMLLIVLRAQIVRVILGAGAFSWNDTRLTAACLALLALSVIAQNITLLLVRAFYAMGDTKKPLFITIFSSTLTIGLGYGALYFFSHNSFFRDFMESLFRIEDVTGSEVLMLPLAYTIGSFINLGLLWTFFGRALSSASLSVGGAAFHSFSASVVMGFVGYKALEWTGQFLNIDTFIGVFSQGVFGGLCGIVSWVLMLYLFKNKELMEIIAALQKRILGSDVVQTDPA